MVSDENKAAVARLIDEVWSRGKLDVVDELLAAYYVIHHDPGDPLESKPLSRKLFKARVASARIIFPDLRFRILEMVAEGDKVAVSWYFRGTQVAPLRGIPATGMQVKVSGLSVFYFEGNRIAGHRQQMDRMGLLQQLVDSGSLSRQA